MCLSEEGLLSWEVFRYRTCYFLSRASQGGPRSLLPRRTALWLTIKAALYLVKTATNLCEIHKTEGSEGEVDSSHHREARDGGSFFTPGAEKQRPFCFFGAENHTVPEEELTTK